MNSPTVKPEAIIVHIDAELESLIPTYLSNRQADVCSLRLALDANDFVKIRHLGHGMKGSGGGYGFSRITDLGAELERAALSEDSHAIASHIAALARYLGSIEIVYE